MEYDIMSKIKQDIWKRKPATRQTYSFGNEQRTGFGFGFLETLSARGIGSVKTHKSGTGRTRSFSERRGESSLPTRTRSFDSQYGAPMSNPWHKRQQEALKGESFRGRDYLPNENPGGPNLSRKFAVGKGKTKSY